VQLDREVTLAAGGMEIPATYGQRLEEPIFDAAFPSRDMSRIIRCAQQRETGQS
jgi:hypothetical protein